MPVDCCACFDQYTTFLSPSPKKVAFHGDLQDTSSTAWKRLLELIDEAAEDGREVFEPLRALSWAERIQVVTLPSTIGRLTAVKKLVLEASNLVRLPAAIGAMTCLEDLDLYQSYRLHWVPYEITRCPLRSSRVSTRAMYGNSKVNAPSPRLEAATTDAKAGMHLGAVDPAAWGTSQLEACSVCGGPLCKTELRQVWITMHVATDMLPLLLNACSESCIRTLPRPRHQDGL